MVLVDEFAHTNTPGSKNEKRWQDVEELLDAGIAVISTVNVQHLESLNDVVAQITGIEQQETIPDSIVRAAAQVELIDITPEALRRRLSHGNVYAAEKIDAALSNYFRRGNLTALRELALLWLADQVDTALAKYRAENKITDTWEARERSSWRSPVVPNRRLWYGGHPGSHRSPVPNSWWCTSCAVTGWPACRSPDGQDS